MIYVFLEAGDNKKAKGACQDLSEADAIKKSVFGDPVAEYCAVSEVDMFKFFLQNMSKCVDNRTVIPTCVSAPCLTAWLTLWPRPPERRAQTSWEANSTS